MPGVMPPSMIAVRLPRDFVVLLPLVFRRLGGLSRRAYSDIKEAIRRGVMKLSEALPLFSICSNGISWAH